MRNWQAYEFCDDFILLARATFEKTLKYNGWGGDEVKIPKLGNKPSLGRI